MFVAEKLPHVRKLHLMLGSHADAAAVAVVDDRVRLPALRVELHFGDCAQLAAPPVSNVATLSPSAAITAAALLPLVLVRERIDALIEVSEEPVSGELRSASYQRIQCRACGQCVCDFSAFAPAPPFALRSLADTAAAAERFSALLFNLGVPAPSVASMRAGESSATTAAADGGAHVLRVLPLPSDHWQELTDLWVCHAEQTFAAPLAALWRQARGDHVLCPPLNTLYVGPSHLLLHPRQVQPCSTRVRVGRDQDARDDDNDDEAGVAVAGGGVGREWRIEVPVEPPAVVDDGDGDNCGAAGAAPAPLKKRAPTQDVWRALDCSSCGAPLGLALLAKNRAAAAADTKTTSGPPSLAALTIKLFKDRIGCAPTQQPSPWNRYSIETRVAAQLAAASSAHGRFRFVLRARARRPPCGMLCAASSGGNDFHQSALRTREAATDEQLPLCIIVAIFNLGCSIASDALPCTVTLSEACEAADSADWRTIDARTRPAVKIGYRAFRPKTVVELAECMALAAAPLGLAAAVAAPAADIEELEYEPAELDALMEVLRARHCMLERVSDAHHVGEMKVAYLLRLNSEDF